MNSTLNAIRLLVGARHATRLVGVIAERWLPVAGVYFFMSTIFQLVFATVPLTILPLVWDVAGVGVVAAALLMTVDTLLVRRPTLVSTARLLERKAGTAVPHPLLAIALELGGVVESSDNELHREVLQRAAGQLPAFSKVSARPPVTWFLPATIIVVALFFTISVLVHPRLVSYWRLPMTMFAGTTGTVLPGSVCVPRGASVTLRFVPKERIAPACQLVVTSAGQGGRVVDWLRDNVESGFSRNIDSLATSFSYKFTYGTTVFGPESVTVVPPPYVQRLKIELHPPAYTNLPIRILPAGQGDFVAYAGTRAHVTIESSALRSAALRTDDTLVLLTVSGTKASGTLFVDGTTSYSFELVDTFSQHSDSSIYYTIGLLPDEVPSVRFLRPGKDKILEPSQRESLLVEAADDLGVRSCFLYWCKNGDCSGDVAHEDLSPKTPQSVWRKEFLWNISRLSLYPGDTLFYWARVGDTRSLPQYAVSDTFCFRLPTINEIHNAMAVRERDTRDAIGSVIKRQDELMKRVEQLDKATGPRSNAGAWERQQLAQNVEQAMRAQADSLQKSVEKLEENIRQLTREGDLGETIARKMDDVRKALKELAAMYGDSLLFPKNEAGEISMEDMRRAVDKLSEMLPDLARRLDSTLRFLEQLKRDSELAQLAMRAEKLAEEQANLANGDRDKKTDARQQDLLDRIEALRKELQQQSSQGQPPDAQTMQQIDSLGSEMSRQLSGKQTPQSATMRQMSGNLSALAQQLREQMSSFMEQQMEALRNKLLDLAGTSIDIGGWQEQLRAGEAATDDDRRNRALSQQAIGEALGIIQQQLDSVPLLPPSLQRKLRADVTSTQEMSKQAVRSLGEGDGNFEMRMSGQSIRQLASGLLATVNAMSQQPGGSCNGGSGGMRESLRRMSGKQAAINAATAQLLRAMMQGQGKRPGENGGEGGEGSARNNEAARKEAMAAQDALAKELKMLGEKFGDTGGEGMKERVRQLEEEARALTQMLNSPQEEVTERQDRFLARMLQSALSLHREDEGKEERKSTSADIEFTRSDGTMNDSLVGSIDTFHQLRQRALQSGTYPQEYRQSINAYFDSLGVRFLK